MPSRDPDVFFMDFKLVACVYRKGCLSIFNSITLVIKSAFFNANKLELYIVK